MQRRRPGLRAILGKHEHSAGTAADAYASISGGLGVVLTTEAGAVYSVRRLEPAPIPGVLVGVDSGNTPIYVRTEGNAAGLTVDYHCAWVRAASSG